MAEYICKIQLPLDKMKDLNTPQPLLGMKAISTSSQAGKFDFYFEDNGGRFIQMFFDITDNNRDAFILIKCVALNEIILKEYIKDYVELEKNFPMNKDDFYYLDRTIVARRTFKEKRANLVDTFNTDPKAKRGNLETARKRKGKYIGYFVKPGSEDIK